MTYHYTPVSPFEESAVTRLQHMGLMNQKGAVNQKAVQCFAGVYAGLLFHDLCDCYNDPKSIERFYLNLRFYHEHQDYDYMFLCYSLQGDSIGKPMPDPVWWMAGQPEAVQAFVEAFFNAFGKLTEDAGLLPQPGTLSEFAPKGGDNPSPVGD